MRPMPIMPVSIYFGLRTAMPAARIRNGGRTRTCDAAEELFVEPGSSVSPLRGSGRATPASRHPYENPLSRRFSVARLKMYNGLPFLQCLPGGINCYERCWRKVAPDCIATRSADGARNLTF